MESKPSAQKKGKKTSPWIYVGVVGAAGVVYYLYKRNAASSSSSSPSQATTGIDPLTGAPYQAGVGSLSPGSMIGVGGVGTIPTGTTTGTPGSSGSATDPTGSGSVTSTPSPGSATTGTGTTSSGGPGGGSSGISPSPGHSSSTLEAWRQAKADVIANAEKISIPEAGRAISQYLQGKPITNAAAARGIANVVKNSGPPPVRNGAALPVRVAKSPRPARKPRATTTHTPARPSKPIPNSLTPEYPYHPGYGVNAPTTGHVAPQIRNARQP